MILSITLLIFAGMFFYSLATGHVRGRYSVVRRDRNPALYWINMLLLVVAFVFILCLKILPPEMMRPVFQFVERVMNVSSSR